MTEPSQAEEAIFLQALEIESTAGEGTRVELEVPAR